MDGIRPTTQVQPHPDVVLKAMDGEGFLLHLKNGNYFGLNETGLKIWKLADGKRSLRQIAALLSTELDIPFEKAEKDCGEFLRLLRRHKLIQSA
jgi:hypothetical protein